LRFFWHSEVLNQVATHELLMLITNLIKKQFFLAVIVTLLLAPGAYALHPLNTDDTGTEGQGRWKAEVLGKWAHNEINGTVKTASQIKTAITAGITDNIDIEVGQPYKFKREDDNGAVSKVDGIADTEIELKWRFYDRNRLSFALRPALTLPAGDDGKGLGTGKLTYKLFLLATKELEQWAFHVNAGYGKNANTADDRTDIWNFSAAAEYEIAQGFKVAGEAGIYSNNEKASGIQPVYTTAAVLYYPVKHIRLDLGLRLGLNKAEPDYTVIPGIAFKF